MKLEVISHNENPTHPTPIVFVHGAWHAAWCWERFQPYFAQHGYASYAVSLRGHGASEGRGGIRWNSAARGYVADVDQVVQTLGQEVILIGHSMGGYVIQKYLETHRAAAAVLLASVPVSGTVGFARRYMQRHPGPFLKSFVLMSPWEMVRTPTLAHDSFFSPQVPVEDIKRHHARLQQESVRMQLETMFLNRPRPRPERVGTPMLVLGAANDRGFTVEEQQATARAYGTEAEIFPDMAHDMMLEPNWQEVADRILGWLQARGL